ncbi:MAG: autotransporter outer membrane beta-barrel domain-containing protein [Candidatus Accumulibacter sp.]|jgi:outer membrane autotransporter protein|nr:autotransporter outer membrane beta-barrel domain-containing protein [Accumulibacter sp.]
MRLADIYFDLNAQNAVPLHHAGNESTLILESGSVTKVTATNDGIGQSGDTPYAPYPSLYETDSGGLEIDKLTVSNGSTLKFGEVLWGSNGEIYSFAKESYLSVKNLDVHKGGTIEVTVPNVDTTAWNNNVLNNPSFAIGNLLVQDDPLLLTKLIGSESLNDSDTDNNGTAGGLKVVALDSLGNPRNDIVSTSKTIHEWGVPAGDAVADALYELRATVSDDTGTAGTGASTHVSGFKSAGKGLYLSYALSQITIRDGKTLVLATNQDFVDPDLSHRDFSATIHGGPSSTLQIGADTDDGGAAADYTHLVSLSNPDNDYQGRTVVHANTELSTNNDNVLGKTRDLDIEAGATVNLKYSQTVGHLGGDDGVTDGLINLTGALTVSGARNVDETGASQNNLANASDGREVAPDNGGKLTNNMLTGNGALTLDASNMLATDDGGAPGANAGFTGGIALANGSTLTVENVDLIGNSGMFANGRSSSGEIAIDNSSRLLFDGDGSDGETLNRNLAGGGVVEVIGGADIVLAGNNKFVDPADIDPETGYPKAPGPWFTGKIVVGDESSVSASVAGTPSTCATAIGNIDCSQDVFGTAAVEVKAGGKLNLTSDSNYLFDHALTGGTADGLPIESANGGTPARDSVGVVKVDGVGAFNFASGSNYTGKVEMLIPAFTLDAGNANSLTNAWLEIEAGNTTRVQGSHALNGLTLNGGDLVFDDSTPNLVKSANSLTVNYLDVESAASEVHLSVGTSFDANPDALNNDARWNLLEQDDVENMTDVLRVVKAQDGEFAANQLQVSQGGVPIDIAGGQLVDVAIRQNGATVATGSYAYKLNPSDGILLQHEMQTVTLAAGRALTLRPDDPAHQSERAPSGKAAAYDLKAKLTGAGGIIVDAGASSGGLVTLSGAGNDYTGATTVKDGTLRLMADEALGKTSDLIVLGARNDNILGVSIPPQATTAAVELNGHTQTVGHLSNGNATDYLLTPGATESAARLDLGDSGKLTVAAGGESFGALIGGAGAELTIDGGRLTVFNDNRPNGLEAAVSIRNAGQAMLNNLGGLGDGAIDIGADASLLLNPQANPPADADRTLTNTLTGAGTVIVDGSQTTSYTGIYADTDAGVVAIVSGANGGFTGVFDITDDDTLKLAAGADAASLGDPAAARIGTNASGALLFDGFEGEIANAIGGSGTVRADNGAKVSIDGDNAAGFTQRTGGVNTPVAGFSGLWDVQHGSTLTFEDANPANVANALGASASELAIDAASRAEIRTDGAFTFDHAIAQSEECLSPGEDGCANKAAPADSAGTLYAETGAGNAFAFSAAASAAAAANFAGTLELGASNFDLSGGNTAALAQSTLKIDAGNRTTVGAGTQNFYGLTFDGGAMVWDDFVPITSPAGHFVSVANLDVSGTGEVWAKRDPSYVYPHPGTVFNTPYLLEHDEGLAGTQLAAAANVTGTAGAIELLDSGTGLPFENAIPALPIDQPGHDGDAVAYGTYGLRLATAHANEMTPNPATGELELTPKNPVPTPDGLYVNYGLVQLDLQAGKTTWLYQRPGYGGLQADMSARIVGAGNLAIDALQGGTDTVSLSNARNAFTGTTTVVTGRLVTDADNALGQTSWLTVQPGAQATLTRFDGQGTAQNVGGLSAPAGARLVVDAGSTLNVVAAQRAAGGIGGLAGGDVGPGALDGAGRVTIAESWVNVEGAQPFGGVWQNGSGVDAASVSRFLNAASLAGAVENHAVVQVGGQDCCAPGVYAGTAPTTLTVAGWDGQDASTLWLGTFMGGDASDTDRLAIDGGAASGQTALAIAQRGGRGARTDVGILVIDALNGATTADDAFYLSELSTGYRRGGVKGPSLVAGPWEYRLVKGGNGGEAESWYLVAAPGYGPETGGHLENRRAAMALLTEHTFHDRQSHTFGQTDNANKQRAGWARVDHDVGSHELGGNLKSHAKIDRLHVGVDLWRADNRDGGEDKADFRFGAMYLHGQLDGKVKGIERKARNETRVDALGLYATWHQRPDQMTGGYVDAWLLAGRARNEVRGDGGPRDKHRARVAAASLEAGYAFVLDEGEKGRWLLEPEAQVIWGRYRAGSRTNKDGIDISGQSDTAVTTRLGARLMGERRRDDGRLLRPFAVANWWHGNASAAMAFDGEKARVNIPKNRAEFKIGVEGEVNKKLTLWGAVGAQTDFGRYRQGELQVGLRYRW